MMRTVCVLGLLVLAAGCSGGESAGGGKIDFKKDVDAAFAKAEAEGKPVGMYFAADW
ncbi:MAG: hypothetical protein ACYTAF_02770 [Planctomycetota bacterium]|jgi:hypothetical protein